METYKQSDINFVNNLANIIFENELKILAEVKHSPEMYSLLLTEQNRKHTSVPLNDEIIISVLNELKEDQQFASETYHILSKQELTEQEKNVITNHILTEGLGRLIKNLAKWLIGKGSDVVGKIIKKHPTVPIIREPGINGKWIHLEGPRRPFKPGVNYEPRPSGPGLPWEGWKGQIPKPIADQFPYPWNRIPKEPPLPNPPLP